MLSGSLLTTLRADVSFSSSEESVLELELELELESELELDLTLDELESDSVSEPELSSLSLSPPSSPSFSRLSSLSLLFQYSRNTARIDRPLHGAAWSHPDCL